jgi:hypothetical protein
VEVIVALIESLAGGLILLATVLILRALWASDRRPTAPAQIQRIRVARVSELMDSGHRKAA